jgi:hypothetical protein
MLIYEDGVTAVLCKYLLLFEDYAMVRKFGFIATNIQNYYSVSSIYNKFFGCSKPLPFALLSISIDWVLEYYGR